MMTARDELTVAAGLILLGSTVLELRGCVRLSGRVELPVCQLRTMGRRV